MPKPIVFLSHSSKDSKALKRLKEGLEEKTHGTIQFFLSSDGESIPFGRNWVATIQNGLESAELIFVFLSPHSLSSGWVFFESGFIYGKNKKVIPVAMPGVDLGKLSPPLSLLQGFNIHSYESLNNIFAILNDHFQASHKTLFSQSEYEDIFEPKNSKTSAYFGEYADYIESIHVSCPPDGSYIDKLKEIIQKKDLPLASPKPQTLSTYGLEAENFVAIPPAKNSRFRVELSPDCAQLSFEFLDELFQLIPPIEDPSTLILFAPQIGMIEKTSRMTGKIYSSPVKFLAVGQYGFKNIQFSLDSRASHTGPKRMLRCSFSGRFQESHLNELIVQLFDLGLLYVANPLDGIV